MNIIKPKDMEAPFRIGLAISRENDIVDQRIYENAIKRLNELKITSNLITVAWVPTPTQIPIAVERLINTSEIHVVAALGSIISDGTPNFEYQCRQVSDGCLMISMDFVVPVIFGLITALDEQSALDRVSGARGNIGRKAIDDAYETLSVIRQIDSLIFE